MIPHNTKEEYLAYMNEQAHLIERLQGAYLDWIHGLETQPTNEESSAWMQTKLEELKSKQNDNPTSTGS